MRNLRITAYLVSPIALTDDWSPAIDSLLQYLKLEEEGRLSPPPHPTEQLIVADLPLAKVNETNGDWYWQVSSPHYRILGEETTHFRKRWEPNELLDWGKKKAKLVTSEGPTKSCNLPLYLRLCESVTWFAVGDKDEIERLLSRCPAIGAKHAYGYGQIVCWTVTPVNQDWHLFGADDRLMRPVPLSAVPGGPSRLLPQGFVAMIWGIRPPYWHHANQRMCAMPVGNVRKGGR